jgi:chaperone modulatory protein CbpM
MMRFEEVVASIAELRSEDLELWMRESLVEAAEQEGAKVFREAEHARVQLICTLYYELEIDSGSLPVVLDLIDQLHDARRRLRRLTGAVLAQDEDVRRAILAMVQDERAV